MSIRVVPTVWRSVGEHLRQLSDAVNQLGRGRSNATGSVTLTESDTTTTISDRNIGTDSVITLSPKTANAAATVDTVYVSAVTAESATLTHASVAQSDQTFDYVITG